jgi:hypothetical protein
MQMKKQQLPLEFATTIFKITFAGCYHDSSTSSDMKMCSEIHRSRLESIIIHDPKLVFTLSSYLIVLALHLNFNSFRWPVLGISLSTPYFLINGIFLSHAFFEREEVLSRTMLGILLLVIMLGSVGWLVMLVYNLDISMSTLALLVTTTLCSLLNRRRMKRDNAI